MRKTCNCLFAHQFVLIWSWFLLILLEKKIIHGRERKQFQQVLFYVIICTISTQVPNVRIGETHAMLFHAGTSSLLPAVSQSQENNTCAHVLLMHRAINATTVSITTIF